MPAGEEEKFREAVIKRMAEENSELIVAEGSILGLVPLEEPRVAYRYLGAMIQPGYGVVPRVVLFYDKPLPFEVDLDRVDIFPLHNMMWAYDKIIERNYNVVSFYGTDEGALKLTTVLPEDVFMIRIEGEINWELMQAAATVSLLKRLKLLEVHPRDAFLLELVSYLLHNWKMSLEGEPLIPALKGLPALLSKLTTRFNVEAPADIFARSVIEALVLSAIMRVSGASAIFSFFNYETGDTRIRLHMFTAYHLLSLYFPFTCVVPETSVPQLVGLALTGKVLPEVVREAVGAKSVRFRIIPRGLPEKWDKRGLPVVGKHAFGGGVLSYKHGTWFLMSGKWRGTSLITSEPEFSLNFETGILFPEERFEVFKEFARLRGEEVLEC